jgi:hypothetical protein
VLENVTLSYEDPELAACSVECLQFMLVEELHHQLADCPVRLLLQRCFFVSHVA